MSVSKTIDFLSQLQENNDKKWMDAHREEWVEIREWWKTIILQILQQAVEVDHDLWTMNPVRSPLRINRDIRFSKNKQPYKTYLGARFSPDGKSEGDAGYYVDFGAKHQELVFYCGAWVDGDKKLQKAIRYKIKEHGSQLQGILSKKQVKQTFRFTVEETLKLPPRGFAKDEEYIELIKMKNWALEYRQPLDLTMTDQELVKLVVDLITKSQEFVSFFRIRNLALMDD
jgi:uncharacterized protein (TIGR02453 family)